MNKTYTVAELISESTTYSKTMNMLNSEGCMTFFRKGAPDVTIKLWDGTFSINNQEITTKSEVQAFLNYWMLGLEQVQKLDMKQASKKLKKTIVNTPDKSR